MSDLEPLVRFTLAQYKLRAQREKRYPSPSVYHHYETFVRDILGHAFPQPFYYRFGADAVYPIINTLAHWTRELPHFTPGRLKTPVLPHITPKLMDDSIMRFMHPDIVDNALYESLRDQLNDNCTVRGELNRPVFVDEPSPTKFFHATPFMNLVRAQMAATLSPFKESHWCMFGRSGGGKSSFAAATILDHLEEPTPPAMLIIDPHAAMADGIERLAHWKHHPDKLLIIDPSESPALSLFDGPSTMAGYLFEAEGVDLTPIQTVAFNYLFAVIAEKHKAEGATIDDLVKMVDAPNIGEYGKYLKNLDPMVQQFFENRFYKGPDGTRSGISQRLHVLLQDKVFRAMFSAPQNKLDLYDALHVKRQTVLVTTRGLTEASTTFLRFIIMKALEVAFSRDKVHPSQRHPILLFVDEAQLVLQGNQEVTKILTETRKYGLFLRTFTQQIALIKNIADILLGQTGVKITASPDVDDASRLARYMRCDSDFLLRPKKKSHFEFVAHVDGEFDDKPILLTLDGPPLHTAHKVSTQEHMDMRATICHALQPDPIPAQPTPPQPDPVSPPSDPTKPMVYKTK